MEQSFLNSCKIKDGQYTVGEKIGEGGFGTVYHCFLNQCHITVKILKTFENEKAVQIFENEITILATLNHPCCLRLTGFELPTQPNSGWGAKIFTPYLSNGTLSDFLFKYIPKLNERSEVIKFYQTLLKIFYGVIRGLNYLHDQKLIHFDIKPDNVLLNSFDYPVITDFGLSIYAPKGNTNGGRGTLLFMAPEIVQGIDKPTSKVDIYSYGMLIYECFNINPLYTEPKDICNIPYYPEYPFEEFNIMSVKLEGYLPEKLDCIPEGLWNKIIVPCLNPNPEKRVSAKDIIQIFENDEELESLGFPCFDISSFDQYRKYIQNEEMKIKIPRRRWHLYHPEQTFITGNI